MSRSSEAVFAVKAPILARSSYREWRRLLAVDEWSPQRLAADSAERARRLAAFAFESSPFYREFYSGHGYRRTDFDDVGVLDALPLLTKELLRENAGRVPTAEAGARNTSRSVTSGSTGEPLALLRDTRVPARAYEWRLMSWWGVSPGADVATIDRYYRSAAQSRKQALLYWPAKRIQMDTFDISDVTVAEFAASWRKVRPDYLTGYVGGVVALVRLATAAGISLAAPTAIGVTAGPLMPAQRAEIEAYFGAPVYDHYRSSEANWMAGECSEQSGLHAFDDIKRIEIVRDGRPAPAGAEGEVVVTDLTNRVFPIIRYATGDVSSRIAAMCRCGRPHPLIEQVKGRVIDFLALPSGKVIVGGLTGTFAGMEKYVRQFQIYQAADFSIEVRVTLTDDADARVRAEERVDRLRRNVNGETTVTMREVDAIVPVRGKLRYILSDAPRVTGTTPVSA